MRRRIAWLVAATTSAVVLAFVIPLALLVRTVASDRAMANANDEARAAAILVSGLDASPELADLVAEVDRRSPALTSVLLPSGEVLGSPAEDIADDPHVARAREGGAFTDLDSDGGRILVPVITADGTSVVRTLVDRELLREGVYRAWVSISLLGLLLLGLALLIADRLGRRVSEPVTDLAAVAERLHQGELAARATPEGPPETVELAETLNRLAERITELLAAERAAVGDLSHRLRTPVTALRLDTDLVDDPGVAARLQTHIAQLQRSIDAIVRDARRPLHESLSTWCDAGAVVAERAAFWSALAEDQGRPVQVEVPDRPLPVALDATDLRDALDVLVDNVFAHTDEHVGFAVRLREVPEGALLEVVDHGPGLAPQAPEHRPGTSGLGLQIVRRTATRAGGRFDLSSEGGGVAARLTLPRPADQG